MNKTIAAITTPHGKGGVSIIRISGDEAITVADKIYRGKIKLCNVESHTINYGYITENGLDIDEVLVSVMHAPKTYTGENVVEINSHGGIAVTHRVLEAVMNAGARLAEPGEFTKRAFLNGRIDLSQAEAVIDIINADNNIAQNNAFGQLRGKLSKDIENIRKKLINLSAHMQVSIDYPDEDLEDLTVGEIINILKSCKEHTQKILSTADNGKIITDGIKCAIVGKPNVGKSSLLNCLSKTNRAIVTDIAGTTRDTIEESVNLNGIPLRLIDTAGIHKTEDMVEKIGVERSLQSIDTADIIFVIIDSEKGMDDEDFAILKSVSHKEHIILFNKSDIKRSTSPLLHDEIVINISAKTGDGIDKLTEVLTNKYNLGEIMSNDTTLITNSRHKAALNKCLDALCRAIEILENNMPQDIAALDIYNATDALGEITGATVSEDIVSAIFHSFCVGK